MAFDHNLASKDLRPLNVARPVVDDSRNAVVAAAPNSATAAAAVVSPDFYSAPDGSIPVFYQAAAPDSGGFVGVGYRNVAPAVGQWVPVAGGNVNMGVTAAPAVGLGYSCNNPNFGNRVVGNNNSVDLVTSAPNGTNDHQSNAGYGYSPRLPNRGSGGGADHNNEDGGDESANSGKKVKLLCSFGGKILPRPSDGVLRYVGGQTRIISIRKEATFGEVMQKMVDTYGQPVVMKYQLPEEDLDALVSVSCPEDLDNMLDEYHKLDGSAKLRVFLFSAVELDASGMVQLGDMQDCGQRYVDAVNGIAEGGVLAGRVISRKGSMASATSTQNSDVSVVEGEASRPPSVGGVSPKGNNSVASQDATPRLLSADPSPPALFSPHEVEFERSANVNVSMGYELPQMGMPMQSNGPYLHAYRDPPRHDGVSHLDYLQVPPQMGYPNGHQMMVTSGAPVFTQHPIHDVGASMSPHQFIPMSPSPSLSPMRATMVQPMMQAQHNQLDHYPDEKSYGTRMMQIPVDPAYNMYRPQMQPAVIGAGGYSWRQVPQQDHFVYSNGMMHHQQVPYPETASALQDCLMCQKALPHAHSDPVAQEQSPSSLDSVYHSLHLEDGGKIRGVNKATMTEALGEGALNENAKVSHEQPRMEVPLGMMGLPVDAQCNYGVLMGTTMPQSRADDTYQQHVPYQGIQETALTMPLHEGRIYDSPKGQTSNLPHVVPNENVVDPFVSRDQLKPLDCTKGGCEINSSNEQNTSLINQKTQQVAARELLLDNTLAKPQAVPDAIRLKPEVPPAAEFSYMHSSQPVEPYDVVQPPYVGDPGAHLQSMVGDLLDSSDVSCVNPQYVVEPLYQVGESHNDVSKLLPNNLASGVESLTLTGNAPSSVSSSSRVEGIQEPSDSLFSNQDPWNLRHDTHFPPPKPLKIATRKDTLGARDPLREESLPDVLLDDGISQTLCNSERTLSSKGSEDRLIKQELQAVAEGVAASVFRSSTPSTDVTGHEGNESHFDRSDPREVAPVKDVEKQHKAKAEDLKNKQPEKVNMGVPMSEGAGRLQSIKSGDLEELKELGSGTFGTVYHGKWRGTDVAIKRINDRCFAGKASEQERMIDDFWNEAIKLADLHHPNVVAFYGVVLDGPGGSVATVTEYMVNGSLRTALQKSERSLDKRKRLLIAMDVAFGMEYLHGKNIVHFDLKSDNLLVNLRDPHRPICKVGDLGLSKLKCQTLISGGVRGTLPWMAPELLNGSSSLVSEKVDVFSFGIVLWELLTGEEPYADLHYGAIIGGIVSNTLRPPVPESCDLEWKSLMERCWSAEPSERPSFTKIASDLRAMAAKVPTSRGQTATQQPQAQK